MTIQNDHFKQNNIPAINLTVFKDSNHLLYENEHGVALNNYEIFHNPIPNVPSTQSYGNVVDNKEIHQQIYDDELHPLPTSNISTNTPKTTNDLNICTQISSIINNPTTKGIYQIKFSNELQNDGGANQSVTNNRNILLHYKIYKSLSYKWY